MYACPLNVLHDAGNQNVFAVGNYIHFQFCAHHVFVHQYGILNSACEDPPHIAPQVFRVVHNGHILTADDIRGAQKDRVAEIFRSRFGFGFCHHAEAFGAFDAVCFKQGVKPFPVLCDVDSLCGSAENRDTVAVQIAGQADGGLPAEGDNHADRFFHLKDVHHIFGAKRFKVQAIRRVVIGGNGFRVVVDNHHIVPELFQRPDAVYRRVVKFNPLTDPDGTGTEYHDTGFPGTCQCPCFTCAVVGGIKIRRLGREFRAAGVYHLVGGCQVGEVLHTRYPPDGGIGIAKPLGFFVKCRCQPACKILFQICQILQFADKEQVYAGDFMNFCGGDAALQRFKNRKQPMVVPVRKALSDVTPVYGKAVQRIQ
ncbi:uncharacterized protein BN660_00603 [Clostridium sp. CAG:448]|nr:uncharacterized protein BN660_00603 [Clostridium sp. CAG:448]